MKKSKAPIILSIISLVFALIAAASAVLVWVAVLAPNGSHGDYITYDVLIQLGGFFLFMALNLGSSAVSFLVGVAASVTAILKKRIGIIWMPILAIVISLVSSLLMFFSVA